MPTDTPVPTRPRIHLSALNFIASCRDQFETEGPEKILIAVIDGGGRTWPGDVVLTGLEGKNDSPPSLGFTTPELIQDQTVHTIGGVDIIFQFDEDEAGALSNTVLTYENRRFVYRARSDLAAL